MIPTCFCPFVFPPPRPLTVPYHPPTEEYVNSGDQPKFPQNLLWGSFFLQNCDSLAIPFPLGLLRFLFLFLQTDPVRTNKIPKMKMTLPDFRWSQLPTSVRVATSWSYCSQSSSPSVARRSLVVCVDLNLSLYGCISINKSSADLFFNFPLNGELI